MSHPRITYQPALDGLRALAVAGVIAYHYGYPWAQGGFLGVDTFFVLSGFLITSLLLRERSDSGRISLTGFWTRRARRLLPALYLMLVVVFIYSAFEIPHIQLDALRGDGFAALFYVSNWHAIAIDHSYFDLFLNPLPLNHLWSLAVEEQFYLVWPLAFIALVRVGGGKLRALWVATIVGIVASQLVMILLYSDASPSRSYYGTDARAHTILVGCLLALILHAVPDLGARAGRWLQALGLVAFGFMLATFNLVRGNAGYFKGGSLIFAVVVAVVIAASVAPAGLLRRGLSVRPLRYVGKISYGLYLWHWPVVVFMTNASMGFGGNALNAVRLAVTTAITVASYHFVEQPILHARPSRKSARALLAVGVSTVLASVLIGTAGATSPANTIGRITGAVGRCGPAPAAETRQATRELRRLGGVHLAAAPAPGTPPSRVAVFGDSRACSLLTGLEVGAKEAHATVANGSILGCGIVAGTIARRYAMMPRSWALSCQGRVNHLVDQLVARDRPDVLVWLSGWEVIDLESNGRTVAAGTRAHRQLLLDRMEALYQRSRAPGRRLVILSLPEDEPSIMFPEANRTFRGHTAQLNQIYREFADRHPDDVSLLDFAKYVCPKVHPCPPRRDGLVPRPFDGIHFSAAGSAWAARWLWPRLVTPPTPTSATLSTVAHP